MNPLRTVFQLACLALWPAGKVLAAPGARCLLATVLGLAGIFAAAALPAPFHSMTLLLVVAFVFLSNLATREVRP